MTQMPRHRRISRLLASGLALAALAVAGGCGQDRITAPAASQASTPASSSLLGGLLGGLFGSGQEASLIECPTTETLTESAAIDIAGGTVSIGRTRIVLPYGAVSSLTNIELTIPASRYMEVEITANGDHINFFRPVLVTIDYSRCDPEVTADRLSAWYINSDTKALLERMPGIDNKLTRSVTFYTGHLSGYALAN
jgi:hypothetical protein